MPVAVSAHATHSGLAMPGKAGTRFHAPAARSPSYVDACAGRVVNLVRADAIASIPLDGYAKQSAKRRRYTLIGSAPLRISAVPSKTSSNLANGAHRLNKMQRFEGRKYGKQFKIQELASIRRIRTRRLS